MPKEFINPNLHVILIHYPLALLVVGTLIELFSFLGWRRSAFRAAGRWMLLIGILSLTPVLFSGLYALADVNRTADTPDDATWIESRQMSPIQGEAWDFMTRHAWSNAIGSVVLLVMLVLWMGSSDEWRRKLHIVYLLVLLFGLGTIIFGAFYGGEMVYRHGVGVEVVREAPSQGGAEIEEGSGSPSVAAIEQTDVKKRIAYYVEPLQTHMVLAGATVSLALAALGLSLRAGARDTVRHDDDPFHAAPEQTEIASALNPSARPPYPGDPPDPYDAPVEVRRPRPPAARFWLIAALLAIASSLSGAWTLAHFSDVWSPNDLWEMIVDADDIFGPRRLAHVVTGGGIIVLLFLLSVIARVTAGRRFIVLLFTLLLIVAVCAQVWFGSLLMFDTPSGRLGTFNGTLAAQESDEEESTEGEMPADEPTTPPAIPATTPVTTSPTATAPATTPASP